MHTGVGLDPVGIAGSVYAALFPSLSLCSVAYLRDRGDHQHLRGYHSIYTWKSQPDQPLSQSHQKAAITRGRIFAVCSATAVAVIEHSPETVHKRVVRDEGGWHLSSICVYGRQL
ncbi:hypothetical protein B0T20DRAFT_394472 [Sordaria brevicollis]|uniref:Uncharacterized protein n=1 Tax=Sordaria brevicollis TaxID=83679 RepID=A0AAE0PCG7_SORBR|nr:hypothetical protein B0T20DRAFT_394472 [Sordaria brevicollis]